VVIKFFPFGVLCVLCVLCVALRDYWRVPFGVLCVCMGVALTDYWRALECVYDAMKREKCDGVNCVKASG